MGFRNGLACLLIGVFVIGIPAASTGKASEKRVPRLLDPAFTHLMAVVDGGKPVAFDAARIEPLLSFVLSDKTPGVRYQAGESGGPSSAYHEFRLQRPLESFLQLTYHPSLPSYLTVPSTVRLSYWTRIQGKEQHLPKLWQHLTALQSPLRIDGVETIVNTPDLFSGAYYTYELDRTIILLRWKGRKVALSLSKQRGPSDVGKKGAVIGPDNQWNYLYTGQEGLSRPGLGWVDSYMYDSFSIIVYVQTGQSPTTIHCGIFKWLDAGWAGINMVRSHHIHRGLVRFADDFKTIVEAPQMDDAERLVPAFERIGNLSTETLRKKVGDYYRKLQRRHAADSPMLRKWLQGAFEADGHLAHMSRPEMESILCIEMLKYLLGKNHHIDVAGFVAARTGTGAVDDPWPPAKHRLRTSSAERR